MQYTVEIGSGSTLHIPSFIKIGGNLIPRKDKKISRAALGPTQPPCTMGSGVSFAKVKFAGD
jgi:hypothetical protein